jgi:uncharacterized protein YjiS (DUF1127 family)
MSYAIPVVARFDHRAAVPRNVLDQLLALLRLALTAGARARIARREQWLLLELPDYLLEDIGIERADIPRAIRQGRI